MNIRVHRFGDFFVVGLFLMIGLLGCMPHSGHWSQSSYHSPFDVWLQDAGERILVSDLFPQYDSVRISSGYGYRISPVSGQRHWHNGIDIGVPHKTLIVAPRTATVAKIYTTPSGGLTLKFTDANQITWGMCHLHDVIVKEGQKVFRGQPIALSGGAAGDPGRGNARAPHLHLTISDGSGFIDPMVVLVNGDKADWWASFTDKDQSSYGP